MSLLVGGCVSFGRKQAEPEPPSPPPPADCSQQVAAVEAELDTLRGELEALRAEHQELVDHHDGLDEDCNRLRTELDDREARVASLEEQLAALEIELESAVEEAVRTKARVASVSSRALAISRIAEVRVQLESMQDVGDEDVVMRLRRAQEFLSRADEVLAEDNFGGAAFLAERASELVRNARTVIEIRNAAASDSSSLVIPIVPPRSLEVLKNSNLRDGPGVEHSRVGNAAAGDVLTAIARSQDWFQVTTESGLKAWISSSLVR